MSSSGSRGTHCKKNFILQIFRSDTPFSSTKHNATDTIDFKDTIVNDFNVSHRRPERMKRPPDWYGENIYVKKFEYLKFRYHI